MTSLPPEIKESLSWQAIEKWIKDSSFQPPLLLTSDSDDLLSILTQNIARQITCEENTNCGECVHCKRSLEINPDVITIDTDEEDGIKIKDVRILISRLSKTATGKKRIAIITNVHKASLEAANALLKSLEEASKSTRFLLTTRWPLQLPQTIRSRCQYTRIVLGNTENQKSTDELDILAKQLSNNLRTIGPSSELKQGLLRLRDYYLIKSKTGNAEFAKEALKAVVKIDK